MCPPHAKISTGTPGLVSLVFLHFVSIYLFHTEIYDTLYLELLTEMYSILDSLAYIAKRTIFKTCTYSQEEGTQTGY